ncbi:hypothetical protein KUCAC02_003510 [Chaenocephalus aceratus]|uniref:Uncharacterized protein n=1 Tax=Chaenocephalus aceratus TaxID=36190 RepID=A0ACB9WKV0_CHAAC|nr:hypothetical protein KUCAC02_003510 [Chaenocephalus aceratus]
MSPWLAAFGLLLLIPGALGFAILPGESLNHLEITERAILNATVQACRELAKAEGADFTFPTPPFTAMTVAEACGTPKSSKSFRQAITFIILRNIRVDIRHALNASFHFDEEMFFQGRKIITEGIRVIKANNKQDNFEAARQKLGEILHPLQDFYSHSNWVELGNIYPNPNLIRSDTSIGNIAEESRATCRNCDGDDCRNNILEDIIEEGILTSGYFGLVPFVSTKPKGKCSHGGPVDQTSNTEPKGGINKDTLDSSHGHLHMTAANMAVAATSELLEDIRGAAGIRTFLQMMGISKGSSKALCFMIDTTKSMSDDIDAVQAVTSSIIDSGEGTEDAPSLYILVPFNDPVLNRKTHSDGELNRISESEAELYRNLAQASGGLAIEVTKSELPVATSIITQSSSSSLVTLLQAARNPGCSDTFSFMVDETIINPLVYITGRSINFTLTSPTGESEQSTNSNGSLIIKSQSVGNFQTLQLDKQVGLWTMNMVSTNPYTLKVIGQSPFDFLFDFVEASQGPFPGYDALDTRPRAGVNGSLLVSLTGSDSATVTEVALVESSGSGEIKGVVASQGSGNFLVLIDRIPSEEFVVRVKGNNGPTVFIRQSSTNFRASNLTITADSSSILEPGTPFSVPFSVMSHEIEGNISIRATNNQGFDLASPTSLFLEAGNRANDTVTLSAPLNTPSGTDVTLTIEAEAPGGQDTNYVVMRFSVFSTVTDFAPPVCKLLSLQSTCSDSCRSSMWELSVQVTDGEGGSGVDSVTLRQGNGTLNTSLAAGNEKMTLVSYNAYCYSPNVELVVVDRVGNVDICFYANSLSTKVIQDSLCLIIVVLGQIMKAAII